MARLVDRRHVYPSLVVFDSLSGAPLLDELLPQAERCLKYGNDHSVHLYTDPDTKWKNYPVLFAHGLRHTGPYEDAPLDVCHESSVRDIRWKFKDIAEVFTSLTCRVVHPFADVVCLFARADEDLEKIADRLALWSRFRSAGSKSTVFRPQLLIVPGSQESRDPEVLRAQLAKLLVDRKVTNPLQDFSAVTFFVDRLSVQSIRQSIRASTKEARIIRQGDSTLFNAVHFERYFHHACDQFARCDKGSFDFIEASRIHRPVSGSLSITVAKMLSYAHSQEELTKFVAPMLADSLILDNYTYEVHRQYVAQCRNPS
jgi:hypothetical protein